MLPDATSRASARRAGLRGGRVRGAVLALLAVLPLAGCAGPGAGGGASEAATAPEDVWESLRRPRPEPLADAPRVTVSDLTLLGSGLRSAGGDGVSPSIGLQELVSVGLLRRRDVHFVERRRFAAAADRERRGEPRPDGAPPVGRSPGADLILTGSWFAQGADSAVLELRLTRAGTGEVVRSWRTRTPADADLPSLARTATGGLLRALDEMGRLPSWDDPLAGTGVEPAPTAYRSADIPAEAVGAYLRGVRAVDGYQWEAARRAFQRALDVAGEAFFEADVALARAARLRAGAPLGSADP